MARYRHHDPYQARMIAVSYGRQLPRGTFEHALSYLIDDEFDLERFAARFKNDDTGARAYDLAVLLKVVLFAYSRGITSSRTMARPCAEHVVFHRFGVRCPHRCPCASGRAVCTLARDHWCRTDHR